MVGALTIGGEKWFGRFYSFTSLCSVALRHRLQYFFKSSFSLEVSPLDFILALSGFLTVV